MDKDKRWYRAKGDELHSTLYGEVQALLTKDTRRFRNYHLRRVYSSPIHSSGAPPEQLADYDMEYGSRHPIVSNAVDTVHGKLAKNRPGPKVVTTNGSWALQRKAQLLQQYLEGELKRVKAHSDLCPAMLKEALLTGTGCLAVFEQDGRPAVELRYCEDLYVSRAEEAHNAVRSLYHTRAVDREVLKGMFPEHAAHIEMSSAKYPSSADVDGCIGEDSDMLLVVEAWRRGTDGRHVMCLENVTLLDEDYEEDHFPFVFLRWIERPKSFWGIGLVERMALQQEEVDEVAESLSTNVERCKPKLLVPVGSDVTTETITDEEWQIIKYNGAGGAPNWVTPDPNPMGTVQYLAETKANMYEENGISQLSAQSQKPAGLDSGAAIRTYQDVETERFYTPGMRYETSYTTLCELLIEVSENIYKSGDRERLTTLGGGARLREIAFGDTRFGSDPYQIQVYPVSRLASSVSGKIAQISELQQLGAVTDPQVIAKLLDLPDLEAYQGLESSARDFAEDLISRAMDGEAVAALVSPYIDLDYAHRLAIQNHNRAQLDGATLEDLAGLHELIGMLSSQIAERQAALAAPPEGQISGPTNGGGLGVPGTAGIGAGPDTGIGGVPPGAGPDLGVIPGGAGIPDGGAGPII